MRTFLEKILSYVLGGILGCVVGSIVNNYGMLQGVSDDNLFMIISIILGVMASIAYVENSQKREIKKSAVIRNKAVALITHEMRTGLTSTGWVIKKVIDKYAKEIGPEDKKMLDGVYESIQTTVSHSINLLDISMLDIGKLSIALEVTSLDEIQKVFNGIIDKFTIDANIKGISIVSKIDFDLEKKVEVDITRLRIIFENILENAVHYTVSGKKEIKVDISNDENNMVIKVADSGIGIPDPDKKNIFKEFYRASNARKVLVSGSGIGLYTCYQYVVAHKGSIRFESKEGVGTTFYVTIPLKTFANVDKFLEKI